MRSETVGATDASRPPLKPLPIIRPERIAFDNASESIEAHDLPPPISRLHMSSISGLANPVVFVAPQFDHGRKSGIMSIYPTIPCWWRFMNSVTPVPKLLTIA